ncbi:hypothetical protein acsn021_28600 [Anaerocolumna cellulosilytica]|uniref:Uncharacterized protein n=1 Tax=Anaerocolumna cellulosilytica TaxID=433286 RepID=A0A6S6R8L8_9FIRM|nr:hypothetical protein [Anaerocolumna cellulosilytica]MBB5197078.1 hypothetical protein [Anaerocolumna cellulosilytica]BCJ95291.1 hypothetical protein acsn021_28600 [Anaerocolumna cellulosilytica]
MAEGILEVKPFQDTYYYSCHDNPIISLIYSVRGDILPVLQNDIFYYGEEGLLSVSRKSKKDVFQLLKEEGFRIEKVGMVPELIQVIKEYRKKNFFLFVPVDACYIAAIEEVYHKGHYNNYMLILSEYNGNITYINTIGVDTAVRTCSSEEVRLGYQSEHNPNKEIVIISYEKKETNSSVFSARENFLNNYRENQRFIIQGINRVEELLHYIEEKLYKPGQWEEFYRKNELFFQTLVPIRMVDRIGSQYYQHCKLFQDCSTIVNIRKMILEEWNVILAILHKYNLKLSNEKNSLLPFLEAIQKVCVLEKEYILTMEWSYL